MASAATADSLPTIWVDRAHWQKHVEPLVADHLSRESDRPARHRAQIARWIVELVTDASDVGPLFSSNWFPAALGDATDAYCYYLSRLAADSAREHIQESSLPALPFAVICAESGRMAVLGACKYHLIHESCAQLVEQLAERSKPSRSTQAAQPTSEWSAFRGAAVEFQPGSGPTRGVCLTGDRETGKTTHAYALGLAGPGNALLADSITCVQLADRQLIRVESQFCWRTRMIRHFPQLTAFFPVCQHHSLDLGEELRTALSMYRDADEVNRAVEAGEISEFAWIQLENRLDHGNAWALVNPADVFGPDRVSDKTPMSDIFWLERDENSDDILREVPAETWIKRLRSSDRGTEFGEKGRARRVRDLKKVTRLLDGGTIRCAVVNTRLPFTQTQFCLRHYLEDLSQTARVIPPHELALDSQLMQTMNLRIDRNGTRDRSAKAIFHGAREVNVIVLERDGQRVEGIAFDRTGEGVAQVRAVWPGQVADFFARHASLRARELFAEIRSDRKAVAMALAYP